MLFSSVNPSVKYGKIENVIRIEHFDYGKLIEGAELCEYQSDIIAIGDYL